MSHPLIDRLGEEFALPTLRAEALDEWLQQRGHSVLFLPGELSRYPEATDVAVVLPELLSAFAGQLAGALGHAEDQRAFARRFAITRWPALVFLRDADYLGAITQMQDWSDYLADIRRLLDGPTRRPPGVGIPVVSA